MLSTKALTTVVVVSAFLIGASGALRAQDTEAGVAAPESVPPEIAAMFEEMEAAGADVAIAPAEEPIDMEAAGVGEVAGTRYLYTTLRVTTNTSTRGCGYANWNCMTRLCKKDLRDNTAWRGWAGCWKRKSWVCYFECGQRRNAF